MLWIKSFHIIFMVTWFSGLFYLPRLFVYHAETVDAIGSARFKIMERKLYYGITTPGAILTIAFGVALLFFDPLTLLQTRWLQIKIGLVGLLILYHLYLGKLLFAFQHDHNQHSSTFYRLLNEIPVLFLVFIVCLAIIKP